MNSELLDRYLKVKSEIVKLQAELDRLRPKVAAEVDAAGGKVIIGPWELLSRVYKTWKFSREIALLQRILKEHKRSEIDSGVAQIAKETHFVMARRCPARRKAVALSTGGGAPVGKGWLAKLQKEHPRAYEPWTRDEELALQRQFAQGCDINELAELFQRQPGGIRSRLRRLGLL